MKICAMSDLHGNLPQYEEGFYDDCELLLICGDIIPLEIQININASKTWLTQEFKFWASSIPVDKVIFIGGNHDHICERCKKHLYHWFSKHDKVTYLHNSGLEYISNLGKVYSIFGSPYCKQFGNWAFMRDEDTLIKKFSEIPENLDILITHDVPYGISDVLLQTVHWNTSEHIGNKPLREAILEKKPKWHFSGHLHSTNHDIVQVEGINHANVSLLDEKYNLVYKPLIVEI